VRINARSQGSLLEGDGRNSGILDTFGALMQTIKVITGLGYYQDQAGHIVAKAELPKGDHGLLDGFTYVEVPDKPALEAVEIWIDPAKIDRRQKEELISDKIRRTAIDVLIAEGKLPADYE